MESYVLLLLIIMLLLFSTALYFGHRQITTMAMMLNGHHHDINMIRGILSRGLSREEEDDYEEEQCEHNPVTTMIEKIMQHRIEQQPTVVQSAPTQTPTSTPTPIHQ